MHTSFSALPTHDLVRQLTLPAPPKTPDLLFPPFRISHEMDLSSHTLLNSEHKTLSYLLNTTIHQDYLLSLRVAKGTGGLLDSDYDPFRLYSNLAFQKPSCSQASTRDAMTSMLAHREMPGSLVLRFPAPLLCPCTFTSLPSPTTATEDYWNVSPSWILARAPAYFCRVC